MEFVELIRGIRNDTDISKNITTSMYEEHIQKEKESRPDKNRKKEDMWYDSLDECIYNCNDTMISLIPSNEKEFYLKQLVIQICSELDEKKEKFDDLNYNRSFNKRKIQNALQKRNNIVSILYLCDYYKVNFVFVYEKEYYETSLMNYKKMFIECNKNHYRKLEDLDNTYHKKNLFDNLGKLYIENDVNLKNLNIYKTDLKAISNYTLPELINIGDQLNIKTKENGKNRKKVDIYSDIHKHKIRGIVQ